MQRLASGFAFVALFFSAGNALHAVEWKTGVEFRRQLDSPVDVHWPDNPLRSSLANLAAVQGVAVFLDRRVDPEQSISFEAQQLALSAVLDRVAQKVHAEKCVIGSVVYVGPKPTAERLATVAALRRQEAAALPAAAKGKLLKMQDWKWDELAMPRDLLARLAADMGAQVENPQLVPHDLWPAVELPALTGVDRLTILLAGFGLTFELASGGTSLRLVPIPDTVQYSHAYAARGDATKLAADLKRHFPAARIERSGSSVAVVAPYEDHEKIERLLRGETVRTTQAKPGEKRYTLTVTNQPAGGVIKAIAKDLGKEMKFAPELTAQLNKKVSFTAKDNTLAELLETTLEPLGLSYNLTDDALEIVEAKPPR